MQAVRDVMFRNTFLSPRPHLGPLRLRLFFFAYLFFQPFPFKVSVYLFRSVSTEAHRGLLASKDFCTL